MQRSSTVWRICFGMVCLTISVYLVTRSLGFLPDRVGAVLEGRAALCESLAIYCSVAAQQGDVRTVKQSLRAIVQRNPDILSAALESDDGRTLAEVGDHRVLWTANASHSVGSHLSVPILAGGRHWGTLQLVFRDAAPRGPGGVISLADLRVMGFLALASGVAFYFYLRKVLRHLDPSKVVPQRVRNTLNTMAEGLVVLDPDHRIVLANEAFAHAMGTTGQALQGRHVGQLPWMVGPAGAEQPWSEVVRTRQMITGRVLKLQSPVAGVRTYRVNCAPLLGGESAVLGTLVSLDDITLLEERNATLGATVKKLKRSRDLIRRQNEQLHTLATRDPLTGCFNRRALFEELEKHLNAVRAEGGSLGCVLVDVDHFKAVNDTHGHAAGDAVLRMVGEVLNTLGEGAIPGRYGGEEFCVILPGCDLEAAAARAETLRLRIAEREAAGIRVTASLGVSTTAVAPGGTQELMERADQALYAAKRSGRNRVIRCDRIPEGLEPEPASAVRTQARTPESAIPYQGVAVLLSCLHYRHPPTADHCRRVADLCVLLADGLMPEGDRYIVEVAALLHDIGILGVPDSILNKEGGLTQAERKILRTYEEIGVDIVSTAFRSHRLTEIIRNRRTWYGGAPNEPQLPLGNDIPLGSRILFLVEAYEAMTTGRSYRPQRSRGEVLAELRRCAGTQFDPELVERLAEKLDAHIERKSENASTAARQAALRIGLQMEQLACALDNEDARTLSALASALQETAREHALDELLPAVAALERQAANDGDWEQIVDMGANLLDLCRCAQSALLADTEAQGAARE